MPRVLIGLGSNLGDASGRVRAGWRAACTGLALRDPRCSRFVTSRPAEGAGGGPFVNAVGSGDCEREPLAILAILQDIERAFGRDREREGYYGARPLDLDLLDVGGARFDDPRLTLPHPRLHDRDFVLLPLAEVAPDFVDARSGRTLADLLAGLTRRWILDPCADPTARGNPSGSE